MKKKEFAGVVLSMCLFMLFGCASQKPLAPFAAGDLNPRLKDGGYVQKVDNFMVVFDASGSMSDFYQGQPKVQIARNIVSKFNRTIPDIKVNGAMRVLGQTRNPFARRSELVYGLTRYARKDLDTAIDTITYAAGGTPLAAVIDDAGEKDVIGDLAAARGNIAVIVVSDADLERDAPAIAAAEKLKGRYGSRLCIYTVLIGNHAGGKKLMEQIALIGGCGFSVTAGDIDSSAQMADFVEKVFFARVDDRDGDGVLDNRDRCPDTPRGLKVDARGCPLDSDGDGVYDYPDQCPDTPLGVRVDGKGCPTDADEDGVYDYLDQCPETPFSVSVDKWGCPPDGDRDGVYDYLDQCPDTPAGIPVDKWGCPADSDADGVYDYRDKCPETPWGATVNALGCWELIGLNFDTARWDIKPVYDPILNHVVDIMKKNPFMRIEIQGHTDSQGKASYNRKLSEKRAISVMEYLLQKGATPGRLKAVGYGQTRPVASNATAEGRKYNRRVELKPSW